MKSPLEQIDELDSILNSFQKIDSLLLAGQFINAWRELRKLAASLQNKKNSIIEEEKQTKSEGA